MHICISMGDGVHMPHWHLNFVIGNFFHYLINWRSFGMHIKTRFTLKTPQIYGLARKFIYFYCILFTLYMSWFVIKYFNYHFNTSLVLVHSYLIPNQTPWTNQTIELSHVHMHRHGYNHWWWYDQWSLWNLQFIHYLLSGDIEYIVL